MYITLSHYTLNIYNFIHQLYLSKAGAEKAVGKKMAFSINIVETIGYLCGKNIKLDSCFTPFTK
jgi:hypothetical protein